MNTAERFARPQTESSLRVCDSQGVKKRIIQRNQLPVFIQDCQQAAN